MDARGHIYENDPEKIPPEDKARLDGFLRGRSEADAMRDGKAALGRLAELEKERIEAELETR